MTIAEILEKLIAAQQAAIRVQELLLEVRPQLAETSGTVIDNAAAAHGAGEKKINEILDALKGGEV